MVAITDNVFIRKPHEAHNINMSVVAVPVTPTASDCLSISGDSSCGSIASLPPCPMRRDPALLLERLESFTSRRRMGRRKRRRASNEAALAVLVEGYEEDSHHLFIRPSRSAFTQLFESQDKMTLWTHFMNMSEEHQEMYLAGAEQRARLLNRSLPCPPPAPSRAPVARGAGVADTRSIHPAALPSDVPALVHVEELPASSSLVSDPVLGPSLFNDHFAPPPRPNHLPFAVANPADTLPPDNRSRDRSLTSDLDDYFSHSYRTVSTGFSHSTPKKNTDARAEETSEERDDWATKNDSNTLVENIVDALYEEAEDTEPSTASSFEIVDPEDDFEL